MGEFNRNCRNGLAEESHGHFQPLHGEDAWYVVELLVAFPVPLTQNICTFIERKKVSITWHYRKADPDFAAIQVQECQELLESAVAKEYDLEVMPGKCNLEIRPKFVNKGEIAKRLLENYRQSDGRTVFVLCAGDDTTDEGNIYQPYSRANANYYQSRYVPESA